jgi:hypothetical protein
MLSKKPEKIHGLPDLYKIKKRERVSPFNFHAEVFGI